MRPIRAAAARRTETPDAVMTTLASSSQGATMALSLWRVDMRAGQRGPLHVVDSEQVWHVVGGGIALAAADDVADLGAGDTVVVPEGVPRQLAAKTDATVLVCGFADALVSACGETTTAGTPPWIG